MALDRDELAARLAVADLSNPKFPNALSDREWVDGWANDVAHAADALIARLRPATVAPVADAAPPDPRRTVGAVVTWAGFTFIVVNPGNGSGVMRDLFIPGDPLCPTSDSDTFLRWATREECERHGIPYVERGAAPSPAASPAAYVPKPANAGAAAYVPQVGDVVAAKLPGYVWSGLWRVTGIDNEDLYRVNLRKIDSNATGRVKDYEIRPATAAERVAAGLDAPAVDDPALEIALVDAVSRVESGLWENFDACRRRRIVVDAVLPVVRARLKAKGGAS